METISHFIPLAVPNISEAEEKAVLDVMRSGWLGNGPVAKQFEKEFSAHFKQTQAVAVNSCTMGLMLCLKAEGIGKGDEVITTSLTFAATVNAILAVGATPVFADVNYTGCIEPDSIKAAITKQTKAIIPVHLTGFPCDMPKIMEIAKARKLVVIEDSAHAFGGHLMNVACGTMGHYGVFSFYPTKNITSADGGMVIGKDQAKLDKIRLLASQGVTATAWDRYGTNMPTGYEVKEAGIKGLLPDLLAAIGLTQLRRWDELKSKRDAIWAVYEQAFGVRIIGHSHHLFTVWVKDRSEVQKKLYKKGIGTGIHYNPLHLEPAYKEFTKSLPNAEKIGASTLSLPLSGSMTIEDAQRVVATVREATK